MAKPVEKYLKKISKLIEKSSASVGENLIRRIEDTLDRNPYLIQKTPDTHLVALAIFHDLFSYHNTNRVTKHESMPNIRVLTLPKIDLTDAIVAASEEEQLSPVVNKDTPIVRLDSECTFDTHLPLLGLVDTFVITTEADQLALVVGKGDIAIRTDLNKHFFNKTGRNGSLRDWIDISRVFFSKTDMLSMTEVVQGCDVFIIDLDKSFVNTTGKNNSMSDWSEIFDGGRLVSSNSCSQPNRENLGCNLSDVEHLILPPKTDLFTPDTFYTVYYSHESILYIHTIFDDAAYGYVVSDRGDKSTNRFSYGTIVLRNSDEICSLYSKLSVVEDDLINFVKYLSKDFFMEVSPTNDDTLKAMVKETEDRLALPSDSPDSTVRQLRQLLDLIRYLTHTRSVFHLERVSIMVKVSTFGDDVAEELLSLKERGMIQSATKLQGSDICELVIHDYH